MDSYPEQSFTPNGLAALANWPATLNPAERARYHDFHRAGHGGGAATVANTFNVAPRVGFAYDLTGDNRTVLKGYYGRFYFNSADTLADHENPVGSHAPALPVPRPERQPPARRPAELGLFRSTQGGAGFVDVDDNISRPYSQELSGHLEREIISGLSGRFSYVYKSVRDEWVEIDPTREAAMTIPFTFIDIGADGVAGTGDDQTLQLLDRPASTPQTRLFTNPDDPAYNSDFQTIEFAINRRFATVDAADVVRLHLAGSVPRHDHRHRRARRAGAGQDLQLAPEPATVRRRGQGNLDAVELQGHRPLRLAVGDRLLGFVEGAERPPVRPQHQRAVPG